MRLAVYTLGCRVNAYESACIADAARAAGFDVVGWDCAPDIGVVNSCALTKLAEAKTRQVIRNMARKNPRVKIAVTGCYAQTSERLNLENVEWLIPNTSKGALIDIIKAGLAGGVERAPDSAGDKAGLEGKISVSDSSLRVGNVASCEGADSCGAAVGKRHLECGGQSAGENMRAFSGAQSFDDTARGSLCSFGTSPLSDRMNLKIQDGCDNWCSYCIIPRARGKPRSRGFSEILSDANNLVARGVRELVLTGINISKFSTPDGGLIELIDALSQVKYLKRLRLGSIEPPNMPLEAILERAADESHPLMPHLHISGQSLSDVVLERMRRHYKAREFLEMAEFCMGRCPNISIGADFICGHPGETEAEFEITKKRLEESRLAYAHIFTFSPRPMTRAYGMKDVPDARKRKSRADELRLVAAALKRKFAESLVGGRRKFLLENMVNGAYFAHTDNYVAAMVPFGAPGKKNALVDARIDGVDSSGYLVCSDAREIY